MRALVFFFSTAKLNAESASTMDFIQHPAFWIVIAAASELIALSPLKDNSLIQLVFHALRAVKGKKL